MRGREKPPRWVTKQGRSQSPRVIEEGTVDGGVQSKKAVGTSPMHLDLILHPHPPSFGEGPGEKANF